MHACLGGVDRVATADEAWLVDQSLPSVRCDRLPRSRGDQPSPAEAVLMPVLSSSEAVGAVDVEDPRRETERLNREIRRAARDTVHRSGSTEGVGV